MAFRRWGMFGPMQQLQSEFERQISGLGSGLSRFEDRVFPAVNVWEDGDNLFAEAEVPGLKNEDLEVSVVGSELTIQGRRPESAKNGNTFHRRERGVGSFTRVLRLPVEIDAERVQAALHDGVLTITLPKHANAKPRKIEVNASV